MLLTLWLATRFDSVNNSHGFDFGVTVVLVQVYQSRTVGIEDFLVWEAAGFTYNITVNSEMNEPSLRPGGWRFQDRRGLEEGAVGEISGVLQLRLLCSCSRCVPLAAAGMRNNATQQAQLLPDSKQD